MGLFKNVLLMLRGSLLGQAIGFAVLPVLARLYLPEDFGRYQIFLSTVSFLLLAASLRYELGILSADTDEDAFALAKLCLLLNCLVAGLTLLGCLAIRIAAPAAVVKLNAALWLLPAVLLAGGAFQTFTYLLLRSHAFRESSASRGIQALGNAAAAVGFGAAHATGVGLMLADLTGRASAIAYACGRMIAKDQRYMLWHQRTRTGRALLVKFREYPMISLPGALLDGIGGSMTPVFMLTVFGAATAGQYALVERSITMPIGVIVQSVSQVYMASFSSALRIDGAQAAALFRKIVFTHLKIGALPAAALFVAGRWGFKLVFGAQWSVAGQIAEIMAPLLLISFIVAPVSMTLVMLRRQKLNSGWYIARVTLVLSAWYAISRLHLPPLSAIGIHVAVNGTAYAALLFMIYRSLPSAVQASGSRVE